MAIKSRHGGVVLELELARVAEHPGNPRASLGDLDGLAASMQRGGLIQPIIVIPVDAFTASQAAQAGNGVQIRPAADVTHVVAAGHRRRAAALQLGWQTIPAIVRTDLSDRTAVTFVAENLHRADLTPIEEAAGYAQLRDMGMGQREIAKEVGVSQGHVSKRLKLLTLPQQIQDEVAAGKVTLAHAAALTELDPDGQAEVWDLVQEERSRPWYDDSDDSEVVAGAIDEVQSRIAARTAKQKAEQQAEAEGVELVDPRQQFGRRHWDHEVYGERDVAKARKAGTLRAEATSHGLRYYTTVPPKTSNVGSSDADRAQRERKKAGKNRLPALKRLLAKPPAIRDMLAEIAEAVVQGRPVTHAESLKMARSLLPAGRFPPTSDYYSWRDAVPDKDLAWVAWAMTVAQTEINARTTYLTWGERQAAHVRRLVDQAGYEPTAWELEELDRVDRRASTDDAGDGADEAPDDQQAAS